MDYTDLQASEQGLIVDGQTIPWTEIDRVRNQMRFKDHVLVSMRFRYGRSNYYDEQYILSQAEWGELKPRMMDREIHLGEIAGKHSDVSYLVTQDSITETRDINDIVAFFDRQGWNDTNSDPIGVFKDRWDDGEYQEESEDED